MSDKMIAVVTVLFGLAYLPWYLKDRKKAVAEYEKESEEIPV